MENALHLHIQQLYQLVSNMRSLPHPANSITTKENMITAYKRLLEYNKLNDILKSEKQYRNGSISIIELHRRMIYNSIYDNINMNTFNYINAVFDNLLFRFPTNYEFNECMLMIDDNSTQILMGLSGNCKLDVTTIICNSDEFYEGLVNWSYITFLGREANSTERDKLMNDLIINSDYQKIQRSIMSSDESVSYTHLTLPTNREV